MASKSSSSTASAAAAALRAAGLKDDGIPWETVLKVRPCFAYQVPTVEGHLSTFCEAWGLEKPIFTGELRGLAKDRWLHLRLISADGSTFADSIWLDCSTADNPVPLSSWLDSAKDSSRYFIIRVGDPGPKPRRTVPIGIGFKERASAFDLNAAIRDRINLTQRTGAHAEEGGGDDAKEVEEAEAKLAAAAQDLSLKHGQRIRVQMKGSKKGGGGDNPLGLPDEEDDEEEAEARRSRAAQVKAASIGLVQKGGSLMLRPPPSLESSVAELEQREKGDMKKKKKGKKEAAPPPPPPPAAADDDEFGDFESA